MRFSYQRSRQRIRLEMATAVLRNLRILRPKIYILNVGCEPVKKRPALSLLRNPSQTVFTSSVFRKRTEVSVTFVMPDGAKATAKAKEGENLLDIVIDNDIDIDGFGACEGTLACSTCHLVFKQKDFDKLPEEATDEELDMLDLAYGLTDTSRLGCQVCMTKDMNGLEVRVPEGVNDQR